MREASCAFIAISHLSQLCHITFLAKTDIRSYLLSMFNETKGGDPMSSEIAVSEMDMGKVLVTTGQPSA